MHLRAHHRRPPPAASRSAVQSGASGRPRRRSCDHEPNRGWRAVGAIALAVALFDWGAKLAVTRRLALDSFHEVWPGRIALWHVRNDAMMLGLWDSLPLDARKLIAVLAALIALAVLSELIGRGHRLPPGRRRWAWLFVGLAFGGMLGNLGERAVHWGVTDYLSLNWGGIWLPPGNVADIALFLSFPIALLVIGFEFRARSLRGRSDAGSAPECNPAAAGG